jgi:5-hydroxyisourate hydrolase
MKLSVQVVDCAFGVAADDIQVCLTRRVKTDWRKVAEGRTGSDGVLRDWHDDTLPAGSYRLEVNLNGYYTIMGITPFIPRAIVEFDSTDVTADLLIPLLVTGNSYFVYRSEPPMVAGSRNPDTSGADELGGSQAQGWDLA